MTRNTGNVVGKPLNGEKTHPLSPFALRVMEELRGGPMPRSGINPGVVDRLLREGCVEVVDLPSPFKTHKGKLIPHLRLIEGAAAATQQFQNWQAFIHNLPRRKGPSAPTHYRYCRWGTQRHRWLDEGHYFDLNVSENPELPTLHDGDYEVQLYHKFADTVEGKGGKRTYYMTPVPLRPQQPNMRLRVQFVGRARPPEELPSVREGSVPEPAPAAKPTRKRCLGSGQTIALQGLQMVMRKAPCPLCGALRSIAPLPGRRAVFPRHNMQVAP